MELSIENICKKYENKTAVDAFTTKFNAGVYGLLGANGAGKTTLLKLVTGILKPSAGKIKYNETEINKLGEDYRDILGYLPQNFGYYPDFKAFDFLMYIASLKGIPHFKAKQKSLELMDLVGLIDEKDKKIKTFSGGMRQRLGIAQAMLNDPKILILDEPTAGLDPKERVRFRNLISSLSNDRIIILSTHIVSDVEFIADEIIVMKTGKLLHKGSVKEITRSIEGYVWEGIVTKEEANELGQKFTISNLKHENDMVYIRIVSEKKPFNHAINSVSNLEDLYLHYFEEGEMK